MTEVFWDELKEKLQSIVTEKDHPFRYATLGTVGLEAMPRLRTIVIRDVAKDLTMTFYTDKRSKKIMHIKENNRVSLLFYDHHNLLQLKVEGLANIIKDEALIQEYWKKIHPKNKKDYTTRSAPGSDISNPDNVEYLQEGNHFCMVRIDPFKIEYLKLKRPNHLRIRFSREESDWYGEFLVP